MKLYACVFALILAVCANARIAERDFIVVNGDVSLSGTLTAPEERPRAALVLGTGSGAQNRDEEVLGHKPFRAIADSLAAHGYAVLRLDDRGVGQSTGSDADATLETRVADLATALDSLQALFPGVPAGALGHSEGGNSVTALAARNPECRFIVTLAAPAWPGDSVIMSQARALATAMTGTWDGEQVQARILGIVKSDFPDHICRYMLGAVLREQLGEAAGIPQVREQIDAQLAVLCSKAYRSLVKYDPRPDMAAVTVPWLAMNGERDFQVLPGNLAAISELAPHAQTVLLPAHNHLFLECTTGFPQEYATLQGDISSTAIACIVRFLDSLAL